MFEKIVLPNGLRVVMEEMPHMKSVTIGVWAKAGSLYEREECMGISHFIEHMIFKGTNQRNAKEIAICMDEIGGHMNAFTSKECTCFHVKTLKEDLPTALKLLGEMLHESKLAKKDIQMEKGVIQEEIFMSEDIPDELAMDQLLAQCWKGHPLSYNVLGTKESVSNMKREDFLEYMEECYQPTRMVISVAGNFDKQATLCAIEKEFGRGKNRKQQDQLPLLHYHPVTVFKEKDIEQNHVVLGFEAPGLQSEERYACAILSNVWGGGMSSRLFQSIREERGLAYNIYSFTAPHMAGGLFGVYAGVAPKSQKELFKVIYEEREKLICEGISEEELVRGIRQMKASLFMGNEGTSSQMSHLGRGELIREEIVAEEEIIAKIQKVSLEDVNTLAKRILQKEKESISIVGSAQ